MKKFKLIVYGIAVWVLSVSILIMNADAKDRIPYVVKQSSIAKNTSNVMSSYALYDNEITICFAGLSPNTKYKVYRKEAKKSWKVVKTFFKDSKDTYNHTFSFTDRKVKSNTRYYYKIYSYRTKKYSKSETYWTAIKHPKKFQQSGNWVTWNKVKGASGYLVWYRKHFSFLGGYYEDNVYYCKIISAKKTSYILPQGCKIKGVYAFTKHKDRYYLNWSGVHKTQGSMKTYVKDGVLDHVIKHKIR